MTPSITTFKTGATLIELLNREAATAALNIAVDVGSRFETETNNGISHLLEHMSFKSTAKFTNHTDASRVIDNRGGEVNAWTSWEETDFHVRIGSAFAIEGFEVILEHVCRPKLEGPLFEKEKRVVLDEVRMYASDDQAKLGLRTNKLLFGNHPFSRPIAGTIGSVQTLTRRQLVDYYRRHYTGNRVVAAVTGNYSPEARALVYQYLDSLPAGKPSPNLRPLVPSQKPQAAFIKGKTPRVTAGISFFVASEDITAIRLASLELGGYPSSYLFLKIRDELGLCYSVGAHLEEMRDGGILTIYFETDVRNATLAVKEVHEALAQRLKFGIEPKSLGEAKSFLNGTSMMMKDNPLKVADFLTQRFRLDGKVQTVDDVLHMHYAVTPDQVLNSLRRTLRNPQSVVVSPTMNTSMRSAFKNLAALNEG